MFKDKEAQRKYIIENYPDVTDARMDSDHWRIFCTTCNCVCGFQVVESSYIMDDEEGMYQDKETWEAPQTIYFKCPICGTYKFWILFQLDFYKEEDDGLGLSFTTQTKRWYKITSVPNDGLEEIKELPTEPSSLRTAYREAMRAIDANAYIAAATMFRRALQIITRDILKAKHGTLARELKSVVGKEHNGVTVSGKFLTVGNIVKEAGNQGAHPDHDPDLIEFTQKDAEDLQKIFMTLVAELFVLPEVTRKTTEEFVNRRKINS